MVYGRPLGAHCTQGKGCRSGECLTTGFFGGGEGVCTRGCQQDRDCDGLRCDGEHCVPMGTGDLGTDCDAPWECTSLLCVRERGAPFGLPTAKGVCARKCDEASQCPEQFACIEINSGQKVCMAEQLLDEVGKREFMRTLNEARNKGGP